MNGNELPARTARLLAGSVLTRAGAILGAATVLADAIAKSRLDTVMCSGLSALAIIADGLSLVGSSLKPPPPRPDEPKAPSSTGIKPAP